MIGITNEMLRAYVMREPKRAKTESRERESGIGETNRFVWDLEIRGLGYDKCRNMYI